MIKFLKKLNSALDVAPHSARKALAVLAQWPKATEIASSRSCSKNVSRNSWASPASVPTWFRYLGLTLVRLECTWVRDRCLIAQNRWYLILPPLADELSQVGSKDRAQLSSTTVEKLSCCTECYAGSL